MKNLKLLWKNFISKESNLILCALFLTAFVYLRTLWGFFQQDEWLSFAHHFTVSTGGIMGIVKDSFAPTIGHFQPFNSLVIHFVISLFGINYFPYAILSILLHLANVYLVFRLAKSFFKDAKGAFIISLIFGISTSIYQATSWVLADIGIHISAIFVTLSLIEFSKYRGTFSKSSFKKTLLYLVISLLFKEVSIGIFAFYFLIVFFSKTRLKEKLSLIKIAAVLVTYILLRVGMIFMPSSFSRDTTMATQSQSLSIIVYNFATLPIKGLTQSIFPSSLLVKKAYSVAKFLPEKIVGISETPAYDLFVQKKVLEAVTFSSFAILMLLAFYLLRKEKHSLVSKAILVGALFVFVNSPVFGLAPERSGRLFIVDSRNLYLLAIGSSFFLYGLVGGLLAKRKILLSGIFALIIIFNALGLNSELVKISFNGQVRRAILQKISQDYSKLPEKVVFYTESDSSYYGLPEGEKIMPFQSGFGQTLLVWYFVNEMFPDEFYRNRFLWEITDQGYLEKNSRGFGYFRDIELLKMTIKEYNLPKDWVIAYKWNSKIESLIDISAEVRKKL